MQEARDLLSPSAQEKLKDPTSHNIVAPGFADGATLYVFVGPEHTPTWLRDLRQKFNVKGNIETRSAAGILIFRIAERLFAATFAHGWMYLDEDNLEGDFGLKATINAVDDTKLSRIDRANLADALRGVSQSPFRRDFRSFGLDDALDLVRRVSGTTRLEASADTMTGSRGLKLAGDFTLDDLPNLADEALAYYCSDAYRQTSFKVLDVVSPIDDPRLISSLDERAVESIRTLQNEFELGLPIGNDDDGVSYRFMGPGMRHHYPDLLLRNYVAALQDRLERFCF